MEKEYILTEMDITVEHINSARNFKAPAVLKEP
jgi:hypothetical protein